MINNKLKATAAALALAAGTLAFTQGSAQAAGGTPLYGELCKARENIQFYNTDGAPSYVVAKDDAIRIDVAPGSHWAFGHGNGHSTRMFQWKHSDGTTRLKNCG